MVIPFLVSVWMYSLVHLSVVPKLFSGVFKSAAKRHKAFFDFAIAPFHVCHVLQDIMLDEKTI